MDSPKFFDPIKFISNGISVRDNLEPDPDFDKKVSVAIQHEIKETVIQLVMTSNDKKKKEYTERVEKLQKIYQGFIKGDNISRIVQIVETDEGSMRELNMTESEMANLLDKVRDKIRSTPIQEGEIINE